MKNDAGVFTPVYNKTGIQMTQMELTSRARDLPIRPQTLLLAACTNNASMPLVSKVSYRMNFDEHRHAAARASGEARNEFRERLYDEFDIDSGILVETQINLAMPAPARRLSARRLSAERSRPWHARVRGASASEPRPHPRHIRVRGTSAAEARPHPRRVRVRS